MNKSLGKVTITAAGTPERATKNETDPSAAIMAHAILIQALDANSGKVYIGGVSLNSTTKVDCYAVLAVPTANTIPVFTESITWQPNPINLADFYIDVEVNGEGVLISYIEA